MSIFERNKIFKSVLTVTQKLTAVRTKLRDHGHPKGCNPQITCEVKQ